MAFQVSGDLVWVPTVHEALDDVCPQSLVLLDLHALELGLFPTNIGTSLSVGRIVASNLPWWGSATRAVAILPQLPA